MQSFRKDAQKECKYKLNPEMILKTTHTKYNPKALLKAVRQHSLNYQEHKYEMSIILDASRTLINLKQRKKSP
jgi:hypothetical protein